MSSQRFRLLRPVRAVAALALVSVLAWPSAAAELPLNTTFRHAGHDLALTFAGGTQPAAFIQKDVDPWDDDLDGKKPPPPRVVVAAGSILQLVPRDDGSLMVAFTQSEGAAESLNGDEAVYVLILRWPTRP